MTIQPGDFWLANISFTNATGSKKRPILVLWLDAQDLVVAAVTSASPRSPTDVLLVDWQTSGLRGPSTVRLSRLDCLEQSLMLIKLGHLSAGDAQRIQQVWTNEIRLQF